MIVSHGSLNKFKADICMFISPGCMITWPVPCSAFSRILWIFLKWNWCQHLILFFVWAHIQQRLSSCTWSVVLLMVPLPAWQLGTCCGTLHHKGSCCYLLQTHQCLLFPMVCLGSHEKWSFYLAVSTETNNMLSNSLEHPWCLHSCLTKRGCLTLEVLFLLYPCVIVPTLTA